MQISSLLVPHYKSSNLATIFLNQSMLELGPRNSCRFGNGERIAAIMDSLSPLKVPVLFLLSTCKDCLLEVLQKEISVLSLDYRNQSQMENACSMRNYETMSPLDCLNRVQIYCMKAEKCCCDQLERSRLLSSMFCPMTWDGVSCIEDTPANITIKVICPKFISDFGGQKLAERRCLENGTWLKKTSGNVTWEPTDYPKCSLLLAENVR